LTVAEPPLLYLDQNYLSGIAKRKPAFRELEPVLRDAVARGTVAVAESAAHRRESAARPDLSLLELLRGLSGGRRLPSEQEAAERNLERRLRRFAADQFPERVIRPSDEVDFEALSIALPRCGLIACDAFMADVIRRAGLDRRFGTSAFGGRRTDVLALRDRLVALNG
jgi:predicted nucleic acid-binding protein